jgi:uncharacterized RDD family membrane protein YckC
VLQGERFCVLCKAEQVRDLLCGSVPGVLDLAGLSRRFRAVIVDGFAILVMAWVLMLGLGLVAALLSSAMSEGSEFVMLAVMLLFYPLMLGLPIVYEALMLRLRGQTLGKLMMGVRVVTPEGGELTWGQAWGRAGMRAVLGGCCALIDAVPAMFDKDKKCIHDMVAKTRVVKLPY